VKFELHYNPGAGSSTMSTVSEPFGAATTGHCVTGSRPISSGRRARAVVTRSSTTPARMVLSVGGAGGRCGTGHNLVLTAVAVD
jgi:hypothetical protein